MIVVIQIRIVFWKKETFGQSFQFDSNLKAEKFKYSLKIKQSVSFFN